MSLPKTGPSMARLVAFCCAACFLGGCMNAAPCLFSAHCGAKPATPPLFDPTYRVAAGDVLAISSTLIPEPIVTPVCPDGCLHCFEDRLIHVDGLTANQIGRVLADRHPDLHRCAVQIQKEDPQFVYLFGEKDREVPQALPYVEGESLIQLLDRTECRACTLGYQLRVVRPAKTLDADKQVFQIELDENLRPVEQSQLVTLQPGDYVYVERNLDSRPLAKLGKPRWIRRMQKSRQNIEYWVH